MAESPAGVPARTRVEAETEFARIVAFTDGVMAIAITLLVLNLELPDVPDSEITAELLNQWPAFLAYAISFVVIGRFWLSHHSFFGALKGFSRHLMAVNLLYLSLIVLIPFTTDVLDGYGDVPAGPILYSLVIAGASAVSWWMNRHVIQEDLVRPEEVATIARSASVAGLFPAAVFLLSVPFALFLPQWAPVFWAVGLLGFGRLIPRVRRAG
jgi:uncharacterized membrane protein